MKLKTMLASMAAVCMLTACEDLFEDGSLQPDGSVPSLKVNSPTRNPTVTAAQGLQVYVTVVDKDKVDKIDFKVLGASGEKALIDFSKKSNKTVVEFDTLVSLKGIVPGDYTLKISAKDKRTNLSEEEVTFTVE
ncbi:Ig-like domain-containing protein [Pontibacter pamirensis]|uniref:Ig-like domain-containing protein n=1 Tax=Pontibacter pamirensis TaxID=2562824 RepID=UPI001389A234|nr:Ig-like domain-containing protein [Pontibacter pamirensis]